MILVHLKRFVGNMEKQLELSKSFGRWAEQKPMAENDYREYKKEGRGQRQHERSCGRVNRAML